MQAPHTIRASGGRRAVRGGSLPWLTPLGLALFFAVALGWWTHGLRAFSVYSSARIEAGPVPFSSPSLPFVDIAGQSADASTSDGGYRLFHFFYASCPEACPLTMMKMDRIRAELGDLVPSQVDLASLSFDHDPVDVVRALWEAHGSPAGWIMGSLTSPDPDALRERLGVVVIRRDDGLVNHSLDLFLVDSEGLIRAVFPPDDSPETIANAIRGFL